MEKVSVRGHVIFPCHGHRARHKMLILHKITLSGFIFQIHGAGRLVEEEIILFKDAVIDKVKGKPVNQRGGGIPPSGPMPG